MRRSKDKINKSLKNEIIDTFVQTLLDFKNDSELKTFLRDFFSPAELENYAKRLAVAYWLKKDRGYKNIRDNLKVSSATISSVQEQMEHRGVKLALKKIEAEEWANKWTEKIKEFVGK